MRRAPFVMSQQALLLDHLCRRYGKLPSEVMHLDNEMLAYQFDMAIMARGFQYEKDRAQNVRGRGNPLEAFGKLRERLLEQNRIIQSDSVTWN